MPYWFYEKKELRHTPSIMMGMSQEEETVFRREGARFILQLGNKMGLRYETMATGVVYFHRFYMIHSFQEFPRHVTACCCLFLAGKVEETPKKCKDIMRHARALVNDTTWAEFGVDPREEVMTLERILLQTIKFDFIVEHPYTYLLKYAKCLKGDKKKLQSMVQMAWTFVNDGLCTTLCVQWEPEIIAIALMYLAGKLNKFEVIDWQGRTPKQQKWWDMYVVGISMELLEDICHQVLDLYSPNKAESSANGASVPSGSANTRSNSSVSMSSGGDSSGTLSTTPVKGANTTNTNTGRDVSQSNLQNKSSESGKASHSGSIGPPSKKAKKEEAKMASPSKTDQPISVVPSVAQSYPYSYPYPSVPGYPAFPSTGTPPSASHNLRYPYQYPSSQPPQNIHSPATQHPGHQVPVTPITTRLPPPASFSTPPNRYPPNTPVTTSNNRPPAHYNAPHVNPHYQSATQNSQYSSPATQPRPYGAAGSQPPHYSTNAPPPPTKQQYTPSPAAAGAASGRYPNHPPVPHRLPPSSQFPHNSNQPPSSYYPPSQSGGNHASSNYMNVNYHHPASNRHYYPPAT